MSATVVTDTGFIDMVRENSGLIFKVCYMYARDNDHLSDLRQEVLANLWEGRGSFASRSKVSTWIYRVAINTCVSYLRRNRRHTGHESLDSDERMAIVDDSSEHASMLRQMYEMIGALGPVDKALIMLWLDEYSYDEIAELTGLKRNNVAVKLHRIKQRLASET